ncbi:MAG: DUF1674 domain-containing protein [Steroidobacteraceae bacterium]
MQINPEKNCATPPSVPPSATDSRRRLTSDLADVAAAEPRREIGGPPGPEPTRFGDWERKGRCIDF